MSTVNDNIRKYRTFRQMSQKQLGEQLNKSTNVISNWENGIHSPDLDTVADICRILKISPDELFGWSENREYKEFERSMKKYQDELDQLERQKASIDNQIKSINKKIADRKVIEETPFDIFNSPLPFN